MLAEFFAALTMPASPAARRLGFVYDMVALRARARRQAKAWAPHQQAARAEISRLVGQGDLGGTAAVLGSGWLLEIPLDDLCARFDQVILVDMVFPKPVRKLAHQAPNVQLVEADVSGVLTPEFLAAPKEQKVPCPAPFPPQVRGADFVVSANILSQIPVHVQKRAAPLDEAAQAVVSRRLIDAHLMALQACRGQVCLLSDFEREERRGKAGPRERFDLLYGARPQVTGERWWWDIAPRGEAQRGLAVRHHVMCGLLTRSAEG